MVSNDKQYKPISWLMKNASSVNDWLALANGWEMIGKRMIDIVVNIHH